MSRPVAEDGDRLPDYADAQRQAAKETREAWYKSYAEQTLAAERDYTGSTGNLSIPPNNIISGVIKIGFLVKSKVKKRKEKKGAVVTAEDAEPQLPDYVHEVVPDHAQSND